MTEDQNKLKRRQVLAKSSQEKMLQILLGFNPVADLRVSDILFIANMTQTISFDLLEQYEKDFGT